MWYVFLALIFVLLALDLGVFHRKAHVISVKEALLWTCIWVVVALLFNVFLYFAYEYHWLGANLEHSSRTDARRCCCFSPATSWRSR